MHNGNHAKLLISSFKLQMQDIQPNFMIDTRGSFIQSMNNRGNATLRTFSLILQRQRLQSDFMTDTIRTIIHTEHNGDNTNFGVEAI